MFQKCIRCKEKVSVRGELCAECERVRLKKYKDHCLGGCGKRILTAYLKCSSCKKYDLVRVEDLIRRERIFNKKKR